MDGRTDGRTDGRMFPNISYPQLCGASRSMIIDGAQNDVVRLDVRVSMDKRTDGWVLPLRTTEQQSHSLMSI